MLVNVHEQSQRNFNALSQLLLHAFCTLFLHFCVAGNYYILRNLILSVRRCRQFSFCATQALKTVKKKKSEKKLNSFGELGVANRARKICHYRHVKAGSTFTYKFLNSLLLSAEKYGLAPFCSASLQSSTSYTLIGVNSKSLAQFQVHALNCNCIILCAVKRKCANL